MRNTTRATTLCVTTEHRSGRVQETSHRRDPTTTTYGFLDLGLLFVGDRTKNRPVAHAAASFRLVWKVDKNMAKAQKESSLDAAKALLRTAQKAILDEANARSIRCTNLTGGYIYFLVLATVVSVAST
mmetsp:Transcript_12000/g.39494  ORF Transcript_12000/g.39494 Transcript_12000/m.39494 type:complete len:128 (-) Transcript_12000:472-855(-)